MANIWVRTGNGGADPDYLVGDLGIVVSSGAGWLLLSASDGVDPQGATGQFSSVELKESADLYDAIVAGDLEYSVNGTTQRTTAYTSDLPLLNDLSDDHLNLSDGRLTVPTRSAVWADAVQGDLFLDTDDGYLALYDGYVVRRISFDGTSDHGDLSGLSDDDHSQYLLLNGNAARNQVSGVIDVSDGYLLLPTVLPSINLSDGQIASSNGITYIYDGYRSKWLSASRQYLVSGKSGNSNNVYLRTVDNIATSATGLRMIRNGTIVGLSAQTTDAASWILEVRKNGILSSIASISISGAEGGSSGLINVDFSAGDELQFYANTSGVNIISPVCTAELAWRG